MINTRCIWIFLSMCCLAGLASGQTIYHGTPDWISSDTPYSTGAAFADIDRDGWLDLVVSNGNDMAKETLAVYYNQGDGTFPSTPDWQAQDATYNGHLDVADVNGDGWPDVAVCHLIECPAGDAAAKLYMNNNGTLSPLPDWTSTEKARTFGIAFGDVNNDGRPDLAVATGWAYSTMIFYSDYLYLNVNGQLLPTAAWKSDDLNADQGVLWVDADDDGWLDLACTGGKTSTRVYRNLGGMLDTQAAWHSTDNPADQSAIMMTSGDVDGDGYGELFVTDNYGYYGGSGLFRQYAGLAAGFYTTTPTWTYFEGYGSALALADIDADGNLDLATGAWWDYTRLFHNGGAGFGAQPDWTSQGTSVVEKILFGDVNPTPDTVKPALNRFLPDGDRRLFHLSRRHIQGVISVVLDGLELKPHQYVANREYGWITVPSAPAKALDVRFAYSVSLDMAISNWDSNKGNYLYYNQREHDWLAVNPGAISAAAGGTADFQLEAGVENAKRNYLLLGSVSGTAPGTPLPGGLAVLPLNWDVFTSLVLGLINTPVFAGFLGILDGGGSAGAKLDTLGPIPGAAGITLYFAYALNNPWDFTSNPVTIEITP